MAAGCAKVFKEKVSGAKTDRPELAKLIRRLEPADVLVVTRLDRLARSTREGVRKYRLQKSRRGQF
jgi:DNA invertase Pin-like site-specific DNA recombinase